MAFVPSSGLKLDDGVGLPEALKTLASNKEEMSRMLQSLKFYESENKRLIDELFAANKIQQTNSVKIADFEKQRQSLQKKLVTGEKILKYEKVASEGLSKKVAMLGQELVEEKESKKNLFDETLIGRKRIIELEKSLSSGRALRLKEMHENELFKRQISGLEARMIESEEDNRRAQTDLLAKIQQLETAVALNQAQGRTIAAQNEEMVSSFPHQPKTIPHQPYHPILTSYTPSHFTLLLGGFGERSVCITRKTASIVGPNSTCRTRCCRVCEGTRCF